MTRLSDRTDVAPAPHRQAGLGLTCAGLLLIGLLTLRPEGGDSALSARLCLVCGEVGATDALLNLALFVPLGAGLALLGIRWRRVLLVGLAVTSIVELLQHTVVAGRHASLGDVCTNTLGALLGAALVASRAGWLRPHGERALVLATMGAGAWLVVLALTTMMLQPAPPAAGYFTQRQPRLDGSHEVFAGRVLDVRLDDVRLPGGRVTLDVIATTRLSAGTARLVAVVQSTGAATRDPAPIARIVDDRRHTRYALAQVGRHLRLQTRLQAGRFRMRAPRVQLDDAFAATPGCAGALLWLDGRLEAGAYRLSAARGSCVRAVVVPLRASLGWALLLPFDHALGTGATLPNALWVAAFVLTWTYWGGRAMAGGRRIGMLTFAAGSVLALAAGLVVIPTVARLPVASVWEWLAAVLALVVGAFVGHHTASGARDAIDERTVIAVAPHATHHRTA